MPTSTLNLEEVEQYARALLNAGILTQGEYGDLWSDERRSLREGGKPITEQDVADAVNQMSLKNSEMTMFQEMSDNVGAEIVLGEWESVRQAMGRDRPSLFESFKSGISNFPTGAKYLLEQMGGQFNPEADVPGGDQSLRDITRALKDRGYEAPSMTFYRNAESFDDIITIILEKTDITPDELTDVMSYVGEVQTNRAQNEAGIEDDIAADELIDEKNLEDPNYAKNMRAYERLERNSPTKFQFDDETGAIYMTDGSGQVDRSGNPVEYGSDQASELVGGWQAGGEPDFSADPAFEGTSAGLAWGKETGWDAMAREMGVAVGSITEGQYMDVLDVINNKGGYGADASRYLSGQDSFLGGYDSTYRVKVEETYARQKMDRFLTTEGRMLPDAGAAFWEDMRRWTTDDFLRPQYDLNDEWAQFAGLSPENVAAVQQRMIEVGALDADEVISGVWGPAEAQQMYKWMDVANASGRSWQDVDEDLIRQMFEKEGAATSQRAAFVPEAYRPMDPARVEMTVKDSIRQMMGRDATSEDLQQLGGYLSDMHGASYEADVKAARAQYSTRVALDESGGQFGQPAPVEDVDFEARYIQEMEKRFAPQLESQEKAGLAGKQQDMGVAMSNLMNRMGGGI